MSLISGRREVSAISIIAALVIAVLVLPPLFMLLHGSLIDSEAGAGGALSFKNYARLFEGGGLLESAWNSIVFSVIATSLSLLFGGVLAWLVERTDVPGKGLAYITTIISLGTPYVLYVAAWLYLLGRGGPFNDFYSTFIQPGVAPLNVYTLAGMTLIEGFLWSPLVFLLLAATFRASNADMEEAARMSGASVLQTIQRITLPLAWPAIAALSLFIFIRNIEAFEVPALVGMPGRVNVLTTDIYRSIKQVPPDLGYASAFSAMLVVVVAVLLYFYSRISKAAERYASVTGKSFRPRPFRLGRLRWFGLAIIVFNFFIILVLPISALLWMSLTKFIQPMRWANLGRVTLDNYSAVLSNSYYFNLGVNSLIVSTSVAMLAVAITFFAGWLSARRKVGGQIIDQLVTVPLVFPGIVLGVAMLQISLSLPFSLYGTLWVIIIGFLIRYMPYGMRYSYSGVLQIHSELEQAAQVSGAGVLAMLRRILLPLLAPALVSGWLFIFLIASKEMAMPLLLAGPRSQTVAVAMFDLLSNGQSGEVAALGLIWTALMTVIAALFYIYSRRQTASTFGG